MWSFTYNNYEWSASNINKIIARTYKCKERRLLKKVGVLAQHPYLFSRFEAVLKYFDRSEVDILYVDCPQQAKIVSWAEQQGFSANNLLAVIDHREYYKVILSHNAWFSVNVSNGYVPTLIGQQHVRLMYSNGGEKEEFAKRYNFFYDAILCYGPRQVAALKKCVEAEIYAIGNPRLDNFFNNSYDYLRSTLGLDNGKKTILWLPTTGGLCNNISSFVDVMTRLGDRYNIILSPHGVCGDDELRGIDNGKIKVLKDIDSVKLMQISDFIFCDYGGSIFSAIYLDKNIVLLDIDDIGKLIDVFGSESSEFYVRSFLPHYSIREEQKLINDLENEELWREQKNTREKLSKEFYSDFKGDSGYKAAKILKTYLAQS